jgi:hypothetical protein
MGSTPVTTGLLGPDGLSEIINQEPEERDYALIGKIALQQTSIEYQLECLIWYYMESVDLGHIATTRLGSVSKTEMLETLVEWIEPDDGVANAITWAIKCFHILRESRNSIIHGYNFKADRRAGKLLIERRTKSLIFDAFQIFEINRDVLEQVSSDQIGLSMFLWRLEQRVTHRPAGSIGHDVPPPDEPARLPARPSEPAPLVPLPHETPKSSRRLRAEHALTEARQAKCDKKEAQRSDPNNRKKKGEP